MDPGDRMIYKPTMQHTECLNHNLKAEKLSDILEKKTRKNILIEGRSQLTNRRILRMSECILYLAYILICIHIF